MYLGIDTSNYTTSLALYDGEKVIQCKKMLNVKHGECGLRQSDAVFNHTVNLPILFSELSSHINSLKAIGVSTRPRNVDGSYMPCFLVGESVATSISACSIIPMYKTSHQVGHILAALYSINRLDLVNQEFIAFHISGGTTEVLFVKPDEKEIICAEIIAQSLDLKAGQAVDRVGVMLGMQFPCGKELDELSQKSNKVFKIKPSMKDLNCSLSGVENKCKKMLSDGVQKEDIAKFCIQYILNTLDEMTLRLIKEYGDLPIVFAGGVMSNSLISKSLSKKYSAYFAQREFSCDNAVGVAIQSCLKDKK